MTTTSTRPIRALAYTRVSTLDQAEHGASLDSQEAALREEADRRGWEVEVIREEGKSAKSIKGRPLLVEAVARLDRGQADVLIAVRLDRVSRSLTDFAAMYDRAARRGWAIVLPASGIDTTAAAGPGAKFSAQVQAAAAELERGLISVRTKEGMAQKKLEGARFGREVDAAQLPAYRRALELSAEGASLRSIAATLTSEGFQTARKGSSWHASTVRAMLTSETAKSL
jgi:DNA invertase Pin-like site-specific DNA recombinase